MTVKLALGIPTINRADLLNDALKVYKDNWVGRDVYIVDNGNQDICITSDNQKIIKTEKCLDLINLGFIKLLKLKKQVNILQFINN